MQLDAAIKAARRAEQPKKPGFVVGFLAGQEVIWLSETLRILQEEAPGTEITISSLIVSRTCERAHAEQDGRGRSTARDCRPLVSRLGCLSKNLSWLCCPANHRLAKHKTIRPEQLAGESFIAGSTKLAPVVKSAVKEYAVKSGISLNQKYDAENISAGMSLAASTGSLMLLPHYVTTCSCPQWSRVLWKASLRPSIWSWATTSPTRLRYSSDSYSVPTTWLPAFRGRMQKRRLLELPQNGQS